MQDEMLNLFHGEGYANYDDAAGTFFSAFRKFDMTGNGHIDMAIWNLINLNERLTSVGIAFKAGYQAAQREKVAS